VNKVLPSKADVAADVPDGASLAISDLGQLMIRAIVTPPITDVMKALSDPVRWSIVTQMAATDELACTTLERTLSVTKSTISYHIKTLMHAHLIEVRKEGRYYFYTLRRDILAMVLHSVSEELGVAEDEMPRAADDA
jgi:DNA-binding transcriptional ArsR family regulator